MTLVSGPLSTVTTTPSAVSQVNISINSPRTRGTGVITPEVKTVAVTGGVFSSQIAPGPAVLTLLIGGRESAPIPILVDDVASQTLAEVVDDARLATGYSAENLAQLVQQVLEARHDVLDAMAGFGQVEEDALTAIGDVSAGALTAIGEAARQAAISSAQVAGAYIAQIAALTDQLEEAYASSEAGQALPPRLTEAAMKKAFAPGGGQQALPLTDVTLTPVEASATPLAVIDGVAYGFTTEPDGYRTIVSSTDSGVTWVDVVRAPIAQLPRGLYKTADGEMLLGIGRYLFRSTGWGTGTITWAIKITGSTSGSVFLPRTVSVHENLVAAAEYGLRGEAHVMWLSTDHGANFTPVFNLADYYPPPANVNNAHIHVVAWDKFHPGENPRLWLANGDTVGTQGIFYSDDLATTWTRISSTEQPTVFHPLPEGILVGTDDLEMGGLRFIDRDTLEISQIWQSPEGAGLPQVALNSIEDEETGVVYMSYRSSNLGTRGLILASVGRRAWPVWWDDVQQPDHGTFTGPFTVHGVTAQGKIMAEIAHPDGRKILWATKSKLGAREWGTNPDSGNLIASGGVASHPTALAMGWRARSGPGADGIAVGHNSSVPEFGGMALGAYSSAGVEGTAVGRVSSATGTHSVAVGTNTQSTALFSLAVGSQAKATGGDNSIAIGYRSSASGVGRPMAVGADSVASASSALAFGTGATASGGSSLAVGATAKSVGSTSVALGFGAETALLGGAALGSRSKATGSEAAAVGYEAQATDNGSVAFGAQSISSGYGAVALGKLSSSSGLSSIAISTAQATQDYSIAIGHSAAATGDAGVVSIGQNSQATGTGGAVAVGLGAVASAPSTVAMGRAAAASAGSSVSVGVAAKSAGSFSTAIGFSASVDATHGNAVAIGANTASTGANQVAIGTRGLTMKNIAEGQSSPVDGALIYASNGNIRVRTADATLSSQIMTLRQGSAIADPTAETYISTITAVLSYLRSNGFIAT